jgi:hypothetical protein
MPAKRVTMRQAREIIRNRSVSRALGSLKVASLWRVAKPSKNLRVSSTIIDSRLRVRDYVSDTSCNFGIAALIWVIVV